MNSFSISELQKYSGIKAHTIRVWEQRYNALKPDRSEGNTRYYNAQQLKRLLNIVSLMKSDYKVSDLCSFTDNKLSEMLETEMNKSTDESNQFQYYILQIISAAILFNESHFEKMFSGSVLRFGLRSTYVNIIYPSLVRLGILWTRDDLAPAQEHFISNLMRQKILSATDALPPAETDKPSWLLFLPEDEFHEMGLLYSQYLLRLARLPVYYLGSNVPFDAVQAAVKAVNPDNLLFFIVTKIENDGDHHYINQIADSFKSKTVYVACSSDKIKGLVKPANVKTLTESDALEKLLPL